MSTSQRVVLAMGLIGSCIGLYGRFNGWEYMEYFPFFYAGMTLLWMAFLPSSRKCCGPFKKSQTQES